MNLPLMLTVNQVAELLQVEPRTIRRNIERGDVPAKKIGRIWRIPRSFVQAYLEPANSDHATTTLHHDTALPATNGRAWGR